jgi:hypothetical protein
MQTSTKVVKSSKKQTPVMSQKQLDAIAELKKYYPELQEDLVINGNLNLADRYIEMLPDNLVVNGSLDLRSACRFDELPNNLVVKGNLYLCDDFEIKYPEKMEVHGSISVVHGEDLPANFIVGDDLILSEYTDTLPENLTVKGSLSLKGTRINELPIGLKVLGNLDLSELPITSLPEDLYVGGNLKCYKTKLKGFPRTVFVGMGLDISHTDIKVFPSQFKVINGDLSIDKTRIKYLPDNLKVCGTFWASDSSLVELPENLHVSNYLQLEGSVISEWPKGLVADECIDMARCPLETLPDGLHVNGQLDIGGTNIKQLPKDLIVNRTLRITDGSVEKLPPFVNAGSLHLPAGRVKRDILPEGFTLTGDLSLWIIDDKETPDPIILPNNMKIGGNLCLQSSRQKSLPKNLFVGGDLDMRNQAEIKSLPDGLKVGGKLKLGRHWEIIKDFLLGNLSIDGTVEMPFEEYRMGYAMSYHVSEAIMARVSRKGDIVTLSPEPKKAPKNQDGGELSEAPTKAKVLAKA